MAPGLSLNTSLAANRFTAYVPTSLGAVNRLSDFFFGRFRSLQPRSAVAAPVRPGNAPGFDAANARASFKQLPQVQPARSSKPLPHLPKEMYAEIVGRKHAIDATANPANFYQTGNGTFGHRGETWRDAFRVEFPSQLPSPLGKDLPLLPDSLMRSSLLNAGLDDQMAKIATKWTDHELDAEINKLQQNLGPSYASQAQQNELTYLLELRSHKQAAAGQAGPASSKGRVVKHLPNTLLDPRTGMIASISFHNGREVQINFSGMGGQGSNFLRGARAVFDRLGWWTPKSYSQASRLTTMVASHLEELNKQMPEDRKLTLSLSGHSMGGAMATYAALRNGVPATVINPLRLGIGTRAKVGERNIKNAPNLVTEVVVQGDWVADSKHAKHIYNRKARLISGGSPSDGIGRRFMVPAPSTQQKLDYVLHQRTELSKQEREDWVRDFDVHNQIQECLEMAA
jgi:hypothetical protein